MKTLEAKYKVGTQVFAKSVPDELLIIQRIKVKTYYCQLADGSDSMDLVYFESELMTEAEKKELA